MSAKLLLRISAGCVLFHIVGHLFGHFTWRETDDTLKQEVIRGMDTHLFDMMGVMRTIGANHDGYSYNLTFSLLMMLGILWGISGIAHQHVAIARIVLIPVMLCLFAFAVADFIFFFPLVSITCFVAGLLIAFALLRLKKNNI